MRSFQFCPLVLLCATCVWGRQYAISTVAGGAPTPTPAPALGAYIASPAGITIDSAGNLFFTASNCVFKLDSTGTLFRIAGDSRPGFLGDGGPAKQAELNNPAGLTVDGQGNIYVADSGNNRIRSIRSDGTIETFAGTGGSGAFGDGGLATEALLNQPRAVVFDATGNLYIADSKNNLVREVSVDGTIRTIAGGGTDSSGSGVATNAQLNYPVGLAISADGTLFIAAGGAGAISKVGTDGMIATFVNLPIGACRPGSVTIEPVLSTPQQMTFDAAGNLLVADSYVGSVSRVSPDGTITRVAGFCGANQLGDGGPAVNAMLGSPYAVTVDSAGSVYIADSGNNRIRKVTPDAMINTVAGGGPSFSGDGGPATAALLAGSQIAADSAGNLYQADADNSRIRKISSAGIISTIAGTGVGGFSGDGGPGTNAQFNYPGAVSADGAGNVYVADVNNQRIRKISPSGVITTVAGNGTAGYSGDGGPATAAQLNNPSSVVSDSAGNLWIDDFFNARIRKVSTAGIITTIAGNGKGGSSGDGGPATAASLAVASLAVDGAGNVYFSDLQNQRVRKVSAGIITTVAGNGQTGGLGDGGPATAAQLDNPSGLAVDAAGNLFIYDCYNNRVRMVAPDGVINTVAGDGIAGYAGDRSANNQGLAIYAEINGQSGGGLAADGQGNIYIADRNNAIRVLQGSAVSTSAAVTNGASNRVGPIAPGEIVVLYGSGLGPAPLVQGSPNNAGVFGTQLAGVQVLFNGMAAPMIYSSTSQVAAIAPYELAGSATTRVQVLYQGQIVFDQTAGVAASNPALFTAGSSGLGQAAAVNQDGTPNSAANPAAAGSVIMLFGTGEGQTSPAGQDGQLAGAPLPHPKQAVSVAIGGQPASVEYAGGAPREVAGLIQINVVIPIFQSPGPVVPVVVTIGGNFSLPGVTIAVKMNP